MTHITFNDTMAVEKWRLLTAVQRAEYLQSACDDIATFTDNVEKAYELVSHILRQARQLDDRKILTGATGELNELYHQARGKTVVLGLGNAQKLPIIAHVVAGLLTGNPVTLYYPNEEIFVTKLINRLVEAGISNDIFCLANDEEGQIFEILNDTQLAQVAAVGMLEDIQSLSGVLSQTQGILTQVIPIVDQVGLQEVFNPDYLYRFLIERVKTTNTTAIGGNVGLLALDAI